jgi:hypothetical protein
MTDSGGGPWLLLPALVLLLLLAVAGCGGDSGSDSPLPELSLPGFGDPAMSTPEAYTARRTLERFLEALATGDYEVAANEFSGDVRFLNDLNEDVAPDDLAELLSRFCRHNGGACLPAEVIKGKKKGDGRYEFEVEFHRSDGSLYQAGDTLVVETLESRFLIRVEEIGTRFFVLDLPPRHSSY